MLLSPTGDTTHLKYVVAGALHRDYILNPRVKPSLDVPGGPLIYSAAGIALWDGRTGLISRIGSDYPQAWLEQFRQRGLDTRGIQILPEPLDLRQFFAYGAGGEPITDNPLGLFAKSGSPFPKGLLGYVSPEHSAQRQADLNTLPLKLANLPGDYFDVAAAHICPLDYNSQISISAFMQNRNITTVTLEAGPYMDALYWERMPALLKGISAYHISETGIRQLFLRRETDVHQMAEALAYYGCDNIIVHRGLAGQWLYNRHNHTHWEIPAYPVKVAEPLGYNHVACGGFLAGFRNTYDPLQAMLYGNIAASLSLEGSSPFYCLDALPDLAKARVETLKSMVRVI